MSINSVVKELWKLSGRWVQVANLLKLPTSVVSTINVLTSHQPKIDNKDALRRVIEWWFVNTANPEWTAIDDLVDQLSKLCCLYC